VELTGRLNGTRHYLKRSGGWGGGGGGRGEGSGKARVGGTGYTIY